MLDDSFTEVGFGFVNANNYQGHQSETIIVAMYASPAPTGITVQPEHSVFGAATQPVSRLQSLNAQAQGLSFVLGLAAGLAITFLVLKHGLALRRLALQGETFLLHHPVLDIALLVIVAVGLFFGRTTGFIV